MTSKGLKIGSRDRVERVGDTYKWTDTGTYQTVFYSSKDAAPAWIREKLNILQVLDVMDQIDGVGLRYSENVFYLEIGRAHV
mgnify:FL=1